MTALSVITNPEGKPKPITVDVEQHDHLLNPFVQGVLDQLEQRAEDKERADFRAAAYDALNQVYGDDEPDYSDVPAYTTRNRS